MNQPILVTGAAGQVGRCLLAGSTTDRPVTGLTSQALDISDLAAVEATVKAVQPALIINAAAYTAVDQAEEEPDKALAVNAQGPENLAKVCAQLNIPLFHISTDYVFDGSGEKPWREEDKVAPPGVYGLTKAEGENRVRAQLDRHLILRTSWVFETAGQNFVNTMLRLGRDRDQLGVVADQFGAPTSARSIADTLLSLAENYLKAGTLAWGTYHYSGAPFVSWHQFACRIMQLGYEAGLIPALPQINPVTSDQYPTPAERPPNSRLDCSKLEATFGIRPDNWDASLLAMINQIKDNR
ncbi:MAG: dTDP-4-dehydrorhamnose reductase [Pontibacterium sp.]